MEISDVIQGPAVDCWVKRQIHYYLYKGKRGKERKGGRKTGREEGRRRGREGRKDGRKEKKKIGVP